MANPRPTGSRPRPAAPPQAIPQDQRPTWGLGEVFGGWLLAVVVSTFVSAIVLSATSYSSSAPTGPGSVVGQVVGQQSTGQVPSLAEPIPLALTALLQLPLWACLLAVPWLATRFKGRGLVRDLGVRMRLVDAPLGVAVGLAAQLLMVPGLYWLLFKVIGDQDVSAEARQLTDRATSPLGVVLLFLIVGIGAPVAEELFFRGFTQRAFEKRGMAWPMAVGATALFFAASHLQPLQFPALFLFGLALGGLVQATGRLGAALWAHVAFNLSAAVVLVYDLGIG